MEKSFVLSTDLSGVILHAEDELPLFTKEGNLSFYEGNWIPHHWHDDLEFVYLREGLVSYFVNGRTIDLIPGQGLFINSRCFHYAVQHGDCDAVMVRIGPELFTSGYKSCSDYFLSKFGRGEPNFVLLDGSAEWHGEIIDNILKLRSAHLEIDDHPLAVLIRVMILVESIGDHIGGLPFTEKDDQDYIMYLQMAKYLHENYGRKVNIDVMVEELGISRTRAYRLFDRYAHLSPNSYLNYYRMVVSRQKLRDTDLPISEIASMCGFQTSSYFTKYFSREIGMSPKAYRDQFKSKK